jgi:hypothetical protein
LINLSAVALSLKISKEIVVALLIPFLRLYVPVKSAPLQPLLEEALYQIVLDAFYLTVD